MQPLISLKMKNVIFILLIQISLCSFSYAQWYQAYSHPIAQSCYALKFYDINTGYHSGVLYNGSTFNIYKTTNGGLNWTSQNSGFTAQRFMAIHIIHPDTVYICGNYGKILRTYNGGQNWTTMYSDTNIQLWAMEFVNSNTGFAAGSFGTILKTTNKGNNWFALPSGIINAFQGMHFINENTGFISGSLVVLKTTNFGTSWTNLNAPFVSGEINTDIFFIDEMTGWFSTNSGRIVKTTNGGVNWNIVLQQTAVWRLSFTNSLTGYGCRSDGKVVKTINGGNNWYIQNTPLSENLYDIHFPAEGTGFIASWSGKILKTTNGGGNPIPILLSITVIPEGFYNPINNTLNSRDTVTAYLRSAAFPYIIVDSTKQVIDSITFMGSFIFSNTGSGTYYIVVKHRNSIETWSKSGGEILTQGSPMNYDFTSAQSQAYGNNLKQLDTSPLRFAIYSGDVNQDGVVDGSDGAIVDNDAYNFVTGYVNSDVNGDDVVDGSDGAIIDNNAFNFVGKITP